MEPPSGPHLGRWAGGPEGGVWCSDRGASVVANGSRAIPCERFVCWVDGSLVPDLPNWMRRSGVVHLIG